MKRFPILVLTTLIVTWLCIASALPASADAVTNYVTAYTASDGSLALLVTLYDTTTSNLLKGPLTIFDKNNNKIVDVPRLGGYSTYDIAHYTGKHLLQFTTEGVAPFQRKFILYKITSKGLKKINVQVVDYALIGQIFKSLIVIYLQNVSQNGITTFNSSLKKVLYSIPYAAVTMIVLPGKDIIVSVAFDGLSLKVVYYKHGKKFAEHYLPVPAQDSLFYKTDTKGGILYWHLIGPPSSPTNLPLTYVTAKNNVKCKNAILQDADVYWHGIVWNGKYLYIRNDQSKSYAAYKITKSAVKMGEANEPDFTNIYVDRSHVYIFISNTLGDGVIEFDKKLNKKKWTEPCKPGIVKYIGNGVFSRVSKVDNGSTGIDVTLTYFSKGKTIATHTYLLPYSQP